MPPLGSKERKIPYPTHNQMSRLFDLVSCPNYTYEVRSGRGTGLQSIRRLLIACTLVVLPQNCYSNLLRLCCYRLVLGLGSPSWLRVFLVSTCTYIIIIIIICSVVEV